MSRWLPALLLALALACRPAARTPVETYLTFLKDLKAGDADAAYALLSTPTQQALQARTDAANHAAGATAKADPKEWVFHGPPPAPTDVKLVQQTEKRAILQVTGSQGGGQVLLVREASGWRIDLTSHLR